MTRQLSELKNDEWATHVEKFGRFNDFPPNWKEVSDDEFWGLFMTYMPHVEEYRQMLPKDRKNAPAIGAKLYFYNDDVGLAMVENYDFKEHKWLPPKLFKFFICDHEYIPLPQRFNCLHESRCKKCGHFKSVDSSG